MSDFSNDQIQELIDKLNSILSNRKNIDDFDVVNELSIYASILIRQDSNTYKTTINQLLKKIIPLIDVSKLDTLYAGQFNNLESLQKITGKRGQVADLNIDANTPIIRYLWDDKNIDWVSMGQSTNPTQTLQIFHSYKEAYQTLGAGKQFKWASSNYHGISSINNSTIGNT